MTAIRHNAHQLSPPESAMPNPALRAVPARHADAFRDATLYRRVVIDDFPDPARQLGARVTVGFESNRDWQPSASGASADARALAFRLLELRLKHG